MTTEELEKRIKVLEDIEAIKQLHYTYVNCLITANWDGVVACFSEDGVVDLHAGLARGKKEIAKLFREEISRFHIGQEGLFVIHPIVKVEGDKAKGNWLLYIQFALPRKMNPSSFMPHVQ